MRGMALDQMDKCQMGNGEHASTVYVGRLQQDMEAQDEAAHQEAVQRDWIWVPGQLIWITSSSMSFWLQVNRIPVKATVNGRMEYGWYGHTTVLYTAPFAPSHKPGGTVTVTVDGHRINRQWRVRRAALVGTLHHRGLSCDPGLLIHRSYVRIDAGDNISRSIYLEMQKCVPVLCFYVYMLYILMCGASRGQTSGGFSSYILINMF